MTVTAKGPKQQKLTLSRYVRARNGVPLGAAGSLRNMLVRSLGAASFADFWRHWNPIWGYYLGRYVFRPLDRYLPDSLAIGLTFLVSGAIHDAVASAVNGSLVFLFTPWFVLMSLGVLVSNGLQMDLSNRPLLLRIATNLVYVSVCLLAVLSLRG